MPDIQVIALFMAAAIALNLTPGPDMLFCLANGMHRGPKAGVAAALGVAAGALVHTLGAAFGLAGLLLASPLLFESVRWAGAAYLAWLAWKTVTAPPSPARDPGVPACGADLRRIFLRGAVTNILNPKVVLFFLAFLPQFIQPEAGPVAAQAVLLGCLMNTSGTLVNAAVGVGAGGLGRVLARNPVVERVLSWLTGIVFLGLAVRLGLASRNG